MIEIRNGLLIHESATVALNEVASIHFKESFFRKLLSWIPGVFSGGFIVIMSIVLAVEQIFSSEGFSMTEYVIGVVVAVVVAFVIMLILALLFGLLSHFFYPRRLVISTKHGEVVFAASERELSQQTREQLHEILEANQS